MSDFDLQAVLEKAAVPEHSAAFMAAMSGGEPFLEGDYLFVAAADWLLAVGYPLGGAEGCEGFEAALDAALRRTKARDVWAICPSLPGRLRAHRRQRDRYYRLPADRPVPPRLERLADRAAAVLTVEEGAAFTAAHRRLWAEFVGRVSLPPNVRELFARTSTVLERVTGLRLLNAWDAEGRLAACLLLDLAPRPFLSYLLGAHSRSHPTPHASDLLFREMIRIARREGKAFIHLGLGVNDGIRRFKAKWGGEPGEPYEMAEWQEKEGLWAGIGDMARVMATLPRSSMSKREYMASLPPQRRFTMLWEVSRDGRTAWIGGTAHFFCYSFENSLRRLFEGVDKVLFEGPLDPASLEQVSRAGRSPEADAPRVGALLNEAEIRHLERVVCGPRGPWVRFFGFEYPNPPDVRSLLFDTAPWMAFFSLWTGYLARQGWDQSVDLEAWNLAREMGKSVQAMETIPEQIATLEQIPLERIVNFLRHCDRWKGYVGRNIRSYLKGDLDGMMGTSTEFPSRTEMVINRRDAIFLERMRPALREGRSAVFVGSAHMLNLRQMLAEDGFTVKRCR